MKLYRYESKRYSMIVDAEMEIYSTSAARLVLDEYEVTSETPKGYWVSYCFPNAKDKWVSKTAKKRFAYPIKEDALKQYKIRKEAYVRHSLARLKRAEEDLGLVTK